MSASDVFMTLHLFLLFGLIGVTSVLMLVTVINRLRLRRVVMSWRTGRFFGLPLPPLLFSLVVLGCLGYAGYTAHPLNFSLSTGYLMSGAFWFVSALLSKTIVVTEYGLIPSINCADRTVAWGQVLDYFTYEKGRQQGFVFFYADAKGHRRRLELPVEASRYPAFGELVQAKVDARFDFTVQQVYGKKTLEG